MQGVWQGDAEQVAEGAEGSRQPGGGLRGGGEQGGGLGGVEEELELAAAAGGLVAESAHQPERAARQSWHKRTVLAWFGVRFGARGAEGWQAAGGEVVHQAGDAARDAVQAVAQRVGMIAEIAEAGGDEGGKGGQNEAEPAGEVGAQGCR